VARADLTELAGRAAQAGDQGGLKTVVNKEITCDPQIAKNASVGCPTSQGIGQAKQLIVGCDGTWNTPNQAVDGRPGA
jgi:hypothetical protein